MSAPLANLFSNITHICRYQQPPTKASTSVKVPVTQKKFQNLSSSILKDPNSKNLFKRPPILFEATQSSAKEMTHEFKTMSHLISSEHPLYTDPATQNAASLQKPPITSTRTIQGQDCTCILLHNLVSSYQKKDLWTQMLLRCDLTSQKRLALTGSLEDFQEVLDSFDMAKKNTPQEFKERQPWIDLILPYFPTQSASNFTTILIPKPSNAALQAALTHERNFSNSKALPNLLQKNTARKGTTSGRYSRSIPRHLSDHSSSSNSTSLGQHRSILSSTEDSPINSAIVPARKQQTFFPQHNHTSTAFNNLPSLIQLLLRNPPPRPQKSNLSGALIAAQRGLDTNDAPLENSAINHIEASYLIDLTTFEWTEESTALIRESLQKKLPVEVQGSPQKKLIFLLDLLLQTGDLLTENDLITILYFVNSFVAPPEPSPSASILTTSTHPNSPRNELLKALHIHLKIKETEQTIRKLEKKILSLQAKIPPNTRISVIDQQINESIAQMQQLQNQILSPEAISAKNREIDKQIQVLQTQITFISQVSSKVEAEINRITQCIKDLRQKEKEASSAKKTHLSMQIEAFSKQLKTLEQIDNSKKQIAELTELKLERITPEKTTLLQEQVDTLQTAINELKKTKGIKTQINKYTEQLALLQKELKNLSPIKQKTSSSPIALPKTTKTPSTSGSSSFLSNPLVIVLPAALLTCLNLASRFFLKTTQNQAAEVIQPTLRPIISEIVKETVPALITTALNPVCEIPKAFSYLNMAMPTIVSEVTAEKINTVATSVLSSAYNIDFSTLFYLGTLSLLVISSAVYLSQKKTTKAADRAFLANTNPTPVSKENPPVLENSVSGNPVSGNPVLENPVFGKKENILKTVTPGINQIATYTDKEAITNETGSLSEKLVFTTDVHLLYPSSNTPIKKHFESLEALCNHIAQERGITPSKEIAETISYSAINRPDLRTKTTVSDALKKQLSLRKNSNDLLDTYHIYSHNSSLNGYSYTDGNGKVVEIKTATSSSADRTCPTAQNLTVVKSALTGQSLCYSGRVETMSKAKEQGLFILSNELSPTLDGSSPPLIEEETDPLKKPQDMSALIVGKKGMRWDASSQSVILDYPVSSLMTDSNLLENVMWAAQILPKSQSKYDREKRYLLKEAKVFKQLKKETLKVRDFEGHVFNVRFNPILFSTGVNAFINFKGPALEGSLSPLLNARAWNALKQDVITPKMAMMQTSDPATFSKVELQVSVLETENLSPLQEILHRDYLFKLLNLPSVYHCKSSTDRTGFIKAASTALQQWIDLGKAVPETMQELIDDEAFKELCAINWTAWHQRSRLSRDEAMISIGRGALQNPIVKELLPKRYLKKISYTTLESTSYLLSRGSMAIVNFIGQIAMRIIRSIAMLFDPRFYGSLASTRQYQADWMTLNKHALKEALSPSPIWPKYEIDEQALFLKERALISKGKVTPPLRKKL